MKHIGRADRRRGPRAPAAISALVILLITLMGGVGQLLLTGADTPAAGPPPAAPTTQDAALTTRSAGVRLEIPALSVHRHLVELTADGGTSMELPPPRGAGWYALSAAPGQVGVSVIAGYIRRSHAEPGVFTDLHKLGEGDEIRVRRADGRTVVYRVTAIRSYRAGHFPTQAFYRGDGRALLRIVTTGGRLRPGAPQGNVVVEAVLVDVR